MEEKIHFESDTILLEGLLARRIGGRGVVITHPHPRYGGDMYNLVVETIMNTYAQFGHTTLRFNFRGNGGSRGAFDNGPGERRDVASALSFLRSRGIDRIDLAGYSFGAWVNAGLTGDPLYDRMLMVSPPTAFMDFDPLVTIPRLALVVTGNRDDIAPPNSVNHCLRTWNPSAQFEIIPGADHFYSMHLDRLTDILAGFLAEPQSGSPGGGS
jgi:hypothetical protein